jgi:hypothetical protein
MVASMVPECDECIAIARELRDACSDSLKDPKAGEHYWPMKEMIEGITEGNGERLDGVLERFPQWRSGEISRHELTPIGRAIRRATMHSLWTGHKLRTMLDR